MSKKNSKFLVKQNDQSDCGVACLLSVIKYYGGNATLEQLREHSGTDRIGTTLLGLMEAASAIGFEPKGYEADSKSLIEHNQPTILHVQKEGLEHYVVFFEYSNGIFTIGDPAEGVKEYSVLEVNELWKSRRCLVLKPNSSFQSTNQQDKRKLNWFYQLVKEDFNVLISSAIIGLILAGLGMATAVFSQKLIDTIIPSESISNLITATILLFFILIIRALLQYMRGRMIIGQSMNFNNRIVNYFYGSLLYLPKRFFDGRETGDMIARLNDTARIQSTITQLVGTLLIDLLTLLVTLAVIFHYSWQIGIIAVFFAPLYFVIIWVHNKRIIESQREVMKSYAQTESFYIDTIKGIGDVKIANAEERFSSQGSLIYGTYQNKVFSLGSIGVSLNLLYGLVGILFTSTVLAFGGVLVIKNTLTIGALMALFALVSALIPSVLNLAMLPIPLSAARIAFDRMFEFTGIMPESINKERVESITDFCFDNVFFRFQGRSALLKGINFDLKQGELVTLTGESGCGKSTIAQIIEKFYPIESGRILVNGDIPLQDININCWRSMVGYVPQNPHVFNGTILENILINCKDKAQDLYEQIKEFGLIDFFNQFPMGINTLVGEKGINLSGGQIQVIAILRGLIKQPQLLILDEVTSAMDRKTEKIIIDLLKIIKPKISILLITHKIHSLRVIADRIYILENGKIEHFGTHKKLMDTDNFYSQYWNEIIKKPVQQCVWVMFTVYYGMCFALRHCLRLALRQI